MQPYSTSQKTTFRLINLVLVLTLLLAAFGTTGAALAAPDAPVQLLSPGDGDSTTVENYPPLGIPEFAWQAVPGATLYKIDISNNIGFSPVQVTGTTANTRFTINTTAFAKALSDTDTWYWRVRVEKPTVAEWSEIRNFKKKWATDTNFPVLVSPEENAVLNYFDQPVFSWLPVMGAAYYQFQVSKAEDFAVLVLNITTVRTTYQDIKKLVNGSYFWRVVPVNPGAQVGTPSAVRPFSVGFEAMKPVMLEPDDNSFPTFTPTFRWTAVRGANHYRLQYSTDPSFPPTSLTKDIPTDNTTYTPTEALPNDVNYYWRVRAFFTEGDLVASDWTSFRQFQKQWYLKATLLTPTNLYQDTWTPMFSWSPVPGAAFYLLQYSETNSFPAPTASGNLTANTFFTLENYSPPPVSGYWRVVPFDASKNAGKPSAVFSFTGPQGILGGVTLAYPLYYYDLSPLVSPQEDRTAPVPLFVWNRVYDIAGNAAGTGYRLEVKTAADFHPVNITPNANLAWWAQTESTSAAPTLSHPFVPVAGQDYFWRVAPITNTGTLAGPWSQIWRARFDTSKGLSPVGGTPQLMRPAQGSEFVEVMPLFEWKPVAGALSYDIQISNLPNFSAVVRSDTVPYAAFSEDEVLAQRNLGKLNFGTYYWRVRVTGSGAGGWSSTGRFQIAAQSQWRLARTAGDPGNRLQVAMDSAADAAAGFDVTGLYAAQAKDFWYFSFDADPVTVNSDYVLYLDLDHKDNSGAPSDALTYNISAIPAHRPEFAIYTKALSGAYSSDQVLIYPWDAVNGIWGTGRYLSAVGGTLTKTGSSVELKIPNTAIGMQEETGSYAVSMFTVDPASGLPKDSVPSDTGVSGAGSVITQFASVSERITLTSPPNNAGVDPTTYPSVLPMFWSNPYQAPFRGAVVKVYRDPLFTTEAGTITVKSTTPYYLYDFDTWNYDLIGDNTYYWRVAPNYSSTDPKIDHGAWSEAWQMERAGFMVENMAIDTTFSTPTFSWDRVEGAYQYDLQVSSDPSFASQVINITTASTSYTSTTTVAAATYYWRVRVKRWSPSTSINNEWKVAEPFTLALPIPSGLVSTPASDASHAAPAMPTLCWDPILLSSPQNPGRPIVSAWKYKLQFSTTDNFSANVTSVDTEHNCYTPPAGFNDGTYYWHVALYNGANALGPYSETATFTKQYAVTELVSPLGGGALAETPMFIWTPVDGAASYKVEVCKSPLFAAPCETITTNNTHFISPTLYSNSVTYYWRVAIVDKDGKVGPWTNATLIVDTLPFRVFVPFIKK